MKVKVKMNIIAMKIQVLVKREEKRYGTTKYKHDFSMLLFHCVRL